MTTSTSRIAYKVYYDILDRAVDSPTGIRVRATDKGDAHQQRVKLHYARTLDRQLNAQGRDRTDPKYGVSDYDNLIVRIRQETNQWWVYIEPTAQVEQLKVEELVSKQEPSNAASKPHSHSPHQATRDIPLRDLRRDVQPEQGSMDDTEVPNQQPRFIRGL